MTVLIESVSFLVETLSISLLTSSPFLYFSHYPFFYHLFFFLRLTFCSFFFSHSVSPFTKNFTIISFESQVLFQNSKKYNLTTENTVGQTFRFAKQFAKYDVGQTFRFAKYEVKNSLDFKKMQYNIKHNLLKDRK